MIARLADGLPLAASMQEDEQVKAFIIAHFICKPRMCSYIIYITLYSGMVRGIRPASNIGHFWFERVIGFDAGVTISLFLG